MATSGKAMTEQERRLAAEFLKTRKLTISEAARRLGLSRPTVRKILKESS